MAHKDKTATDPYRLILGALEAGKLAPGTRLRETDLAEAFNTSRTPIRHALNKLMSQGLVVQVAGNGLALAKLQYLQIVELYQIRERLEGAAVKLATVNRGSSMIEALENNLNKTRQNKKLLLDVDADDWDFHQIIYSSSKNKFLLDMLENIRFTSMLIPKREIDIDYNANIVQEHERILDEIRRGDADRACRVARNHIIQELGARIPFLVQQDVELTLSY